MNGVLATPLLNCVNAEVITAVTMKNTGYWKVTPCNLIEINRRLGGKCYLLYPEGGVSMFLRKFTKFPSDYMTSHFKRPYSSNYVNLQRKKERECYIAIRTFKCREINFLR
jgi:hypothetical protein